MSDFLDLFTNFLIASVATFGFAIFMQVPKKHVPFACITGGLGWLFYVILVKLHCTDVVASFIASCSIGVLSEFLARKLKTPSIIVVIPGILPLVPGRGLYYTMEYFIEKDYLQAISTGVNTMAIAGAISLGLISVVSFARTLSSNKRNS